MRLQKKLILEQQKPQLMKRTMLLSFAFVATAAYAQKSAPIYAITGATPGSTQWNVAVQLQGQSLASEAQIYHPNSNIKRLEAQSKQPVAAFNPTEIIAATAYDKNTNRLYFSPLHGNDLRYFDLSNGNTMVYVTNGTIKPTSQGVGEANNITRMTFAADGNGYALTNDGNHLVQFTSGTKVTINNLGALTDSKNNKGISIHNACTSWGGDMVGDAFGNLYLFTVRGHIFKINIRSLVAEHIGSIKGLPDTYTINGAAVTADGQVLVSSSVDTKNYFKVHLGTLQATPVDGNGNGILNASDLASGYLAFESAAPATQPYSDIKGNAAVTVYPNPITNGTAVVKFEKVFAGKYTVQILTTTGTPIMQQIVDVNAKTQAAQLDLGKQVTPGMYLMKVLSAKGDAVYTDRIIVQ